VEPTNRTEVMKPVVPEKSVVEGEDKNSTKPQDKESGTIDPASNDPANKTTEEKKEVQEPAEEMPEETTAEAGHPFRQRFDTPDFPRDLQWLNTAPLKKKDLKGKFVLLDFWTYCCINCMHILPELKKLEHEFANELVVIGVHSAKFEEEKQTANIREAILRYEIEHPVVNDANHDIWDMFQVNSWPTVLMLDPEGKAVWGRSGEFKAEEVAAVLKKAIPYYKKAKLLSETPIKFALEVEKVEPTPLRFPGKVLADEASNRLFIADSNHNRIVVTTLDAQLLDIIGSGEIGRDDGNYKTCSFNHPQGMVLHGETLYLCDTENHLLRKIDLKEEKVTTIAGTGKQAETGFPGFSRFGGNVPKRFVGKPKVTALNSPWDLWIHEQDLYIAMAGPHQIWKMPLDEDEIGPFAGNGREDIVDGPLLPSNPYELGFSSFAQPSGLSSDGTWLYVADSEGSSVRAVPFDKKKEVQTLVGTNQLPNGRLFYFGDRDGPRNQVKLQHCLGVVYHEGKVYIADTYNNKIKVANAKTGDTETLAGTGKPGADDNAPTFDEPAGITLARGKLFVADTNNHLIRTVDLSTKQVATFKIGGLNPPVTKKAEAKSDFTGAPVVKLPLATLKAVEGQITLTVEIQYPEGWKLNPLGRPTYHLASPKDAGIIDRAKLVKTKLPEAAASWNITLPVSGEGEDVLTLSTNYYRCQTANEGVCKTGAVVFEVPIKVTKDATETTVALKHVVVD
jgi:thiol-disulfide isomerase/thioredoxin